MGLGRKACVHCAGTFQAGQKLGIRQKASLVKRQVGRWVPVGRHVQVHVGTYQAGQKFFQLQKASMKVDGFRKEGMCTSCRYISGRSEVRHQTEGRPLLLDQVRHIASQAGSSAYLPTYAPSPPKFPTMAHPTLTPPITSTELPSIISLHHRPSPLAPSWIIILYILSPHHTSSDQ